MSISGGGLRCSSLSSGAVSGKGEGDCQQMRGSARSSQHQIVCCLSAGRNVPRMLRNQHFYWLCRYFLICICFDSVCSSAA
jgi:hypothetical protein